MKQNKLSFESENLQVDYLTFNIQGTADFDLINYINLVNIENISTVI